MKDPILLARFDKLYIVNELPLLPLNINSNCQLTVRVKGEKAGTSVNFKSDSLFPASAKTLLLHKASIYLDHYYSNRFEISVFFKRAETIHSVQKPVLKIKPTQQKLIQPLENLRQTNGWVFDNGKLRVVLENALTEDWWNRHLPFTKRVWGSEVHGRPSFFLYQPPNLEFPAFNWRLGEVQTKKPTAIRYYKLIYDPAYITVHLPKWTGQAGYRGATWWEVKECPECVRAAYNVYRSPRGSTGIDEGVLLSIPKARLREKPVYVEQHLTGRLYGQESPLFYKILRDGRLHDACPVSDTDDACLI